ncbi:helix-turn-helix domain-containing protein [Pseudoduganella sp. FT25W]|uniref:Helix-turn-helix domain-containing protein n=1 Tax=Duganella alba TaxID=2666081 RepID=A0A6L5QGK4_9BURK|nr:helix-turn-helix transcriptional regulator [Duganella alba]MRX08141.1 helix-turn-helix domain-containing protein [Duganella alba]MRX16322.1 helix-turn-helix domain-containing protein [Duganella alba]
MTTPFGRFIHRVRTARRLSQKQLAFQLGVHPSYVNRIESGLKSPSNHNFLESVVHALQLPADEAAELFSASKASQNAVRLPPSSTERGRLLVRKLVSSLPQLNDPQLAFLELAVDAINAGAIGNSAK